MPAVHLWRDLGSKNSGLCGNCAVELTGTCRCTDFCGCSALCGMQRRQKVCRTPQYSSSAPAHTPHSVALEMRADGIDQQAHGAPKSSAPCRRWCAALHRGSLPPECVPQRPESADRHCHAGSGWAGAADRGPDGGRARQDPPGAGVFAALPASPHPADSANPTGWPVAHWQPLIWRSFWWFSGPKTAGFPAKPR